MEKAKKTPLSKRLLKYLLSIDLFVKPINLRVNKSGTHNTLFGSILSISIMTFVCYTFVDLILEIQSQKSPILNFRTEYQKDPELTELQSESFQVAVTLTNKIGSPIKQSINETIYLPIFSVCNRTTQLINGQMEMKTQCDYYQMTLCSFVQNKKLLKSMGLEQEQLEVSYCIPDEARKKKIVLEGYSFSSVFQVIAIDVYKCKFDLIQNGTCADQETIDYRLTDGYIGFIISDRLFNPQEQGNPFLIYGKIIFTAFDSRLYKILYAFLRHNYIQTILNFFYYFSSTTTEYKELMFEKLDEFTSPSNTYESSLVSFIIQLDDKKISYYRKYATILDILGDIGGLYSSLVVVIKIIANPISTLLLEIFLANQIFTFDPNLQEKKTTLKSSVFPEEFNYSDQKYQSLLRFFNNEQNDQNTNLSQKIEIRKVKKTLKQKLNGLKFTFSNYLRLRNQIQKKQFQSGVEAIYEKIDSVYLIKKILEIDKLKYLLLTPQQLVLFENSPKPKIITTDSIDREQLNYRIYPKFNLEIKELKFLDKLKQSYDAYRQIHDKELTQIDIQLINMFDQDHIYLFNQALNCMNYNVYYITIEVGYDKEKLLKIQYENIISSNMSNMPDRQESIPVIQKRQS